MEIANSKTEAKDRYLSKGYIAVGSVSGSNAEYESPTEVVCGHICQHLYAPHTFRTSALVPRGAAHRGQRSAINSTLVHGSKCHWSVKNERMLDCPEKVSRTIIFGRTGHRAYGS
jgi:hypothetical protein